MRLRDDDSSPHFALPRENLHRSHPLASKTLPPPHDERVKISANVAAAFHNHERCFLFIINVGFFYFICMIFVIVCIDYCDL